MADVTKTRIGESYKYFATMGGIFQFKDNCATILTDVCEDGCDIDVTPANANNVVIIMADVIKIKFFLIIVNLSYLFKAALSLASERANAA